MSSLHPNAFGVVQSNVNPFILHVFGGTYQSSTSSVIVPDVDLTLAASSTTSIWLDTNSLTIKQSTNGFPVFSAIQLAVITTNAYNISSITDARSDVSPFDGSTPGTLNAKSYGAKGDTKLVIDVSTTNNSPIITSSSASFSQSDIGKVADLGGNGTTWIASGTILSVQSSTQVTLSVNAQSTSANVQLVWGTDDTTALLAWVAAVVGSAATVESGISHTGYLPSGTYYCKQSLNFSRLGGFSGAGGWQPGIRVFGDGATNSIIQMAPPSKFTFTAASTYSAIQFSGWQFNRVFGFSVLGNSIAANILYSAGGPPNLIIFNNCGHTIARDLWVFNFFGASSNMSGLNVSNDLESTYEDIANETGDINLTMSATNTKVTFRNVYMESANAQTFKLTGTPEELSFINCDFLGGAITPGAVIELNTSSTNGFVSFYACRFKTLSAPVSACILCDPTGASTFNFFDCTCNLNSGAANLTGVSAQANSTVKWYGGSILGTGTGNAVISTGSGIFLGYGPQITGTVNIDATLSNVFTISRTATTATAGTNGAPPAQVNEYLQILVNGNIRKIPLYSV